MMKRIMAGASLVAIVMLGSLPGYAQQTKPAPAPAPATASTTVSPEELQKFAGAVKQVLAIARETDTQMAQVVQKEGLTEARFNEIFNSKKQGGNQPKTPISDQEKQQYERIVGQLTQIQKNAMTKMDQAVQSQGLDVARFNQIFTAVKQDPKLREQVQKLIQS